MYKKTFVTFFWHTAMVFWGVQEGGKNDNYEKKDIQPPWRGSFGETLTHNYYLVI